MISHNSALPTATQAPEEFGPLPTGVELHHVAYVVRDIEAATVNWRQRFGALIELPPILVTAHEAWVSFLRIGSGRIELVQASSERSPVQKVEPGQGRPDHLCFLCDDLDATLARMQDGGALMVRPPVPSEAFAGRRMAFLYVRDIGLVEWVER